MPKAQKQNNRGEKIILTILSLISLGLLIAIVYVWYNTLSANKISSPGQFLNEPIVPESASPSAQTQITLPLTISSPQDGDVVSTKSVTVSGQTLANAPLTITGGKTDVVDQADEAGSFSQDVDLNEGDNSLTVTIFDELGNQNSQTLTVIYAP